MIDHDEAINRFIAMSGLFKESFDENVLYWKEGGSVSIIWSGFGRVLITNLDSFEHEELVALFFTVEEFLCCGTESLKNNVATCFLEAVINRVSDNNNGIVRYFGEQARAYCIDYDNFAGRTTAGLSVPSKESKW